MPISGWTIESGPQIPTLDPSLSHQGHRCQFAGIVNRHSPICIVCTACHDADRRQSAPAADQTPFRATNDPADCQVTPSQGTHDLKLVQDFRAFGQCVDLCSALTLGCSTSFDDRSCSIVQAARPGGQHRTVRRADPRGAAAGFGCHVSGISARGVCCPGDAQAHDHGGCGSCRIQSSCGQRGVSLCTNSVDFVRP